MYEKYFKRLFDIVCALAAIIVFSWLYIIVAILVRVKLGSPVLFKQKTMTDERDENGNLLPDKLRLTKFGRLLRSTSLDEIPEAFNILKGDMSVIGPRPLAVVYLPFYDEEERKRHKVRPGLSGLAQVNGRNALTWEEKFAYDVKYVEKITFMGDCKIILQTVMKVLKRSDIGQGTETVESFHVYRQRQMSSEKIM